jgi:hypothetical protein
MNEIDKVPSIGDVGRQFSNCHFGLHRLVVILRCNRTHFSHRFQNQMPARRRAIGMLDRAVRGRRRNDSSKRRGLR